MTRAMYKPFIKQAARSFFQNEEKAVALLTRKQDRGLTNAISAVWQSIQDESERMFIKEVYTAADGDFHKAITQAAQKYGINEKSGWAVERRFSTAVMEQIREF